MSARRLGDVSPETLETTREACAWLHDIALEGERQGGTPEVVVQWLERLGSACDQELQAQGLMHRETLQ